MNYEEGLIAAKAGYPFEEWKTYEKDMEQYTPENCDAAKRIFDDLISKLIMLGEHATEEEKVSCFNYAVESLNDLNEEVDMCLIETGEREQLCTLIDEITVKANLKPDDYADGDGLADEWRDW